MIEQFTRIYFVHISVIQKDKKKKKKPEKNQFQFPSLSSGHKKLTQPVQSILNTMQSDQRKKKKEARFLWLEFLKIFLHGKRI